MGNEDGQRMCGTVTTSVILCHLFRAVESDGLSPNLASFNLIESKIMTCTPNVLKSSFRWKIIIIPILWDYCEDIMSLRVKSNICNY